MGIPTIRDFPSITSELVGFLVTLAPQITDYVEGGTARSILESLAIETQRLDYSIFDSVKTGIEVGTYRNFDFGRLPASPTSATVKFTRAGGSGVATILQGVKVKVPGSGRIYTTVHQLDFVDGQTVGSVGVLCDTPGTIGNTPSNTITEIVSALGFDATVTNPDAAINGLDQETDDARRSRFRLYIAGLSRGTAISIQFAALSVFRTDVNGVVLERVTAAFVHEPYKDTPRGRLGVVEVYVDNGSGSASPDLLTLVTNVIQGYVPLSGPVVRGFIAAGMELTVLAAIAKALDVTGTITVR